MAHAQDTYKPSSDAPSGSDFTEATVPLNLKGLEEAPKPPKSPRTAKKMVFPARKKSLPDRDSFAARLEAVREKDGFILDMDGVVYRDKALIPGAKKFLLWAHKNNKRVLFLTNNSKPSPAELQLKLDRMGLKVDAGRFFTSAMSTARFLSSQKRHCTAYVIGEAGLYNALYEEGIRLNDVDPDYVVVGESDSHNTHKINRAAYHVMRGAKLIGTSPDVAAVVQEGIEPACGAWVAVIEKATGRQAYFLGKPNPLMMRIAVERLGCDHARVSMVGDRMDTDIIGGIESLLDPVLVLSGVTTKEEMENFPYRPFIYLDDLGCIPPSDFPMPTDEELAATQLFNYL